ncbi:DEKNAAC103078 [Brettanomyces naardenensis]|uniref:DEKNAAC103078 n=1 Tax=Brettanomyces naardenensis TaxID=13370 RepID=A0A448YM95_BRENA|nr:DEKNAAC103078 [Brettanomyces naardenensis]
MSNDPYWMNENLGDELDLLNFPDALDSGNNNNANSNSLTSQEFPTIDENFLNLDIQQQPSQVSQNRSSQPSQPSQQIMFSAELSSPQVPQPSQILRTQASQTPQALQASQVPQVPQPQQVPQVQQAQQAPKAPQVPSQQGFSQGQQFNQFQPQARFSQYTQPSQPPSQPSSQGSSQVPSQPSHQHHSSDANRKANMAKFMALPPDQRRRLLERQRQYQDSMVKQQQKLLQQQQLRRSTQNQSQMNQQQQQQMFHQLQQQQPPPPQPQQNFQRKPSVSSQMSTPAAITPAINSPAMNSPAMNSPYQQYLTPQQTARQPSEGPQSQSSQLLQSQHSQQTPQGQPPLQGQQQQNQSYQNQFAGPQSNSPHTLFQSQSPSSQSHPRPTAEQQRQLQQQLQQQFGMQNVEKFLILLEEFMARRGTPLPNKYPEIGGRRMNLFLIYFMVSKLGGFVHVLKTGKIPFIASKLGIDPNSKPLMTEFVQVYHKSLFPFEQFANTPQGMKELAVRRQQLQKQPSGQQSQQSGNQRPVQSQAPPQAQPQVQSQSQQPNAQSASPQAQQSQPLPFRAQQTHSPYSAGSAKTPGTGKQSPATTAPVQATPRPSEKPSQPLQPPQPSFIRNYVPHSKLVDRTAGYNLEAMESYGEQLDHLKPVFLYFPELGTVSIQALSLSLASHLDAEINVALNVLLIITSDPSVTIPLDDCMDLMDNLCLLGLGIIDCLRSGDYRRRQQSSQELVSRLNPEKSHIDTVFNKYKDYYLRNGKAREIKIDSFTSQEVECPDPLPETADAMEVESSEGYLSDEEEDDDEGEDDDVETNNGNDSVETSVTSVSAKEAQPFSMPQYLELLHGCRDESEDFERGVHAKTYENRQLMLVEELSTISMIIRNLSFIHDGKARFNNTIMATNTRFLDYLYALMEAIGTNADSFILSRKKLCFMKDTIIILTNIAHAVDVRSEREMFLIIALSTSFGSAQTEEDKKAGFLTTRVDQAVNKYQLHGVDVVSKILCGSRNNKRILANVLIGDTQDSELLVWLQKFADTENLEDGSLAVKLFSFLISTIPLELLHQGIEPFNNKLPSCLEALLGCIVLLEIVRNGEFSENLALNILMAPEAIGSGLVHLAFVYAAIYVNTNFETKIQHAYISSKCSQLVNTLIRDAIDYSEDHHTVDKDSDKLSLLSGFFSNDNNLIGVLITPNIPTEISAQAVESTKLMSRLRNLSS